MSPTQIISDAWDLYRRFWSHFAGVGLSIYVVAGLIALVLVFLGPIGLFLGSIVVLIASFLLTGALVTAVQDVRDGRADLTIGETLSKAAPYIGALLVAGILAGLAIALGLIVFIIPGIILATIWYVISPAIVLENTGFWKAFGRSFELVKPYFWPVLGVLALTFVILFVAGFVIGLILVPLPDWLSSFISTVIQGAVIAPFVAVATTLTFFRLRELEGGA